MSFASAQPGTRMSRAPSRLGSKANTRAAKALPGSRTEGESSIKTQGYASIPPYLSQADPTL